MKLKAIGAFLAIRALSLVALFALASYRDVDFTRIFRRWDAQWYRRIAEDGYGTIIQSADGRELSDYAFFPLYPLMERLVHNLTSLNYIHSGILISVIASLAAAAGIYGCVDRVSTARVALYTTILWAALPVANVQILGYSESLFTALAAWSLYFLLRKQWYFAALLALLAGATRPTGIAVALAVMVGAVIQIRKKGATTATLFALLASPLGWIGYLYWVGRQVGQWDGYLEITKGWGNSIDGGRSFVTWWSNLFTDVSPIAAFAVLAAIGALLLLIWFLFRRGIPAPLIIYAVAIVVLALITSGYFSSKPRYLVPAFPLLIPIAIWLSHLKQDKRQAIFGTVIAISLVYGGFWLTGNGPL